MEVLLFAQSSIQKLNFCNSSERAGQIRYQSFSVLSSFTRFIYFVPNILPGIVVLCLDYINHYDILRQKEYFINVFSDKFQLI